MCGERRSCNCMREITDIKELQLIELDILKYFDWICRKNNLTYFLAGGTLLGAIRHKGFIPWDDDVDVIMPRQDFERLIELFKKDNSNYTLLYPGCSSDYYYTFGKLIDNRTVLDEYTYSDIEGMGVYIDIFILDGLPDKEILLKKHFDKLTKLRRKINRFSTRKPDIKNGLIRFLWNYYHYAIWRFGDINALQEKLIKLSRKFDYYESKFVFVCGGAYGTKDIFTQIMYGCGMDCTFEDVIVRIPSDYELNLKQLYGDFMKLPPEEKRISHHSFRAWHRN